jgi:hypothetical protein
VTAIAILSILAPGPEPFRVNCPDLDGPAVSPSHTIRLDTRYAGEWLVAGDLDGDGRAEFIAARNDNQAVTGAAAYRLDGTLLWTWGEEGKGKSGFSYDVPLMPYDLDGDGKDEVFLSVPGSLVVLDGETGKELRRHALPEGLAVDDCISFADLSGVGRPTDIIAKTRYTKLWAFTADWRVLWSWAPPEGYLTCHHPTVLDIDGDGKDEVLAGYTMLDHDGTPLWTYETTATDLRAGHLDASDVVHLAPGEPEDTRIIVTCCGANLIALLDGSGKALWEIGGYHFESPDFGKLRDDVPGPQFVVDIDHVPYGQYRLWLIGPDGTQLGTFVTGYGRHHRLVDWNGDGLDELLITNARAIYDGHGSCVARLVVPGDPRYDEFAGDRDFAQGDPGPFGFVGDVDGDGRPDVVLHTDTAIYVFTSPGARSSCPHIGTGLNWTLY